MSHQLSATEKRLLNEKRFLRETIRRLLLQCGKGFTIPQPSPPDGYEPLVLATEDEVETLKAMRCLLLQEVGFGDMVATGGILGNATKPTMKKKTLNEIEAMADVDGEVDGKWYGFGKQPAKKTSVRARQEYSAGEQRELEREEERAMMDSEEDYSWMSEDELELEDEEEEEEPEWVARMNERCGRFGRSHD